MRRSMANGEALPGTKDWKMSQISVNRKALDNLIRDLPVERERFQKQALEDIAEQARANVHVITGLTRGSIRVEGDTVIAEGGALYEEFGTRDRAPHPFLRPAFEAVLQDTAGEIEQVIRKATS